jgi:hypothetical protein
MDKEKIGSKDIRVLRSLATDKKRLTFAKAQALRQRGRG